MEIEIRGARVEDAVRIAPLLGELGYPTEAHAVRRRLDTLIGDASHCCIVATHAGHIVGFGAVHVFRVVHHDDPVALITALVVAGSARGGGVGSQLVGALEQHAAAAGCNRITVTSAEHRVDAHAFYPRLGYTYTGRRFARRLDNS